MTGPSLEYFATFIEKLRSLGVTRFGGDVPGFPGQSVSVDLGALPRDRASEPDDEPAPIEPAVPAEIAAMRAQLGMTTEQLAELTSSI